MKCSIIIVNWNVRDLLRRCLQSIEQYGQESAEEVWVVDNRSADGSAEMVRNEFPSVRLIANDDNRGFAAAANQGLRQAAGDGLLLLNSDTELTAGCLQILIAILNAHADIGLLGPRLVGLDGRLQPSCARKTTPIREFTHHLNLDRIVPGRQYPVHRWPPDQLRDVDVLQGACWLMRRAMLDQIGWMDESYYMYSEDDDLCERAAKAGWRRVWCPMATVLHHGGASTRIESADMLRRYYMSKFLFYRRHRGRLPSAIFRLLLSINLLGIATAGRIAAYWPGAKDSTWLQLARRYGAVYRDLFMAEKDARRS